MAQEDVFKKLVSHCKEYGFVFPSSEIYDGLGAVYDYGQYVEIDVEGLDIKVKQMELEDGATPVNAVMANIPIKGSRNFRRSSQQH